MIHQVTNQLTLTGHVTADPVHALGPKPTREQLSSCLDPSGRAARSVLAGLLDVRPSAVGMHQGRGDLLC